MSDSSSLTVWRSDSILFDFHGTTFLQYIVTATDRRFGIVKAEYRDIPTINKNEVTESLQSNYWDCEHVWQCNEQRQRWEYLTESKAETRILGKQTRY